MLPIILYDINGNKLSSHKIIMRTPTFYIYSYEKFTINSLDNSALIFSVTKTESNELLTRKGFSFSNNFGYTIYCETDTVIEIINSEGKSELYTFEYKPYNILEKSQAHYNDLLINHYLPTFEELEPALLPGVEKADLLKRLLLDFKDILRSKGTKSSIEKFFYFIGFLFEQITVLEEYCKNKTNPDADLTKEELLSWINEKNVTTRPDTTVDTKTGNYHVLFDNWNDGSQNGMQDVNSKNMPFRPFAQQNLDKFFEALKYAISLANTYFTLVEQEITFFGISFSVNIPMFQSITSSMNQIFENDLNAFRKKLHIDFYYNYVSTGDSKIKNYLVKNCLQKDDKAYRSETKYIAKNEQPNNELYLVEKEIADNEIYDGPIESVKRLFGCILHVNVESPNTYVQLTIESKNNELIKLVVPKQYVEHTLHSEYFTAINGDYKLTVEIWDVHNNYEKYFYYYSLQDDVRLLDIDVFNSYKIIDDNFDKNHIDLDVDSGTLTSSENQELKNYILPINNIPEDLRQYWSSDINMANSCWLSETNVSKKKSLYILPEINKNYKVDEITDTIPVTHTDQWLEFVVIPYIDIDKLTLTVYDADEREYVILKNFDWELDPTFDKLFIRKMQITEQDGNINDYLFICPIETGINMCKSTFDLGYIVNEYNEDIEIVEKVLNPETNLFEDKITIERVHRIITESIYDNKEIKYKKIPVNFDFPLFPIDKADEDFVFSCITDNYPVVKSLFPRLQNIDEGLQILSLGDVILVRLNADKVCGEIDVKWSLFNEFTGALVYTTNDYALKYRLDDNIIYTIQCEFMVNSTPYKLVRTGILSSFKLS